MTGLATSAAGVDPDAVMARVAEVPASELWPEFDPCRVPVALHDGAATFLYGQPVPPEEFTPRSNGHGGLVYPGRHPAVVANSTAEIGGAWTATVDLTGISDLAPLEVAALVVHEAFHVFQRERHPAWGANEADLFLYPVEDVGGLALRLLEDGALHRALAAPDDDEAARWAAAALDLRRERFALLPDGAVTYERSAELHEGLARYIEWRVAPGCLDDLLSADGFEPDAVRLRAYATGASWALLLDRLAPGWQQEIESGAAQALDNLLRVRLSARRLPAVDVSMSERERARTRAEEDIAALLQRQAVRRAAFLTLPGWRLVVEIDAGEPLWPRGFDPMNVERLGPVEVLHGRYLVLRNASGTLEVLDRSCLTVAAGHHPLFTGVRQVTIAGEEFPPAVRESDGEVGWEIAGCRGEFRGARLDRRDSAIFIRVDANP